MATSFKNGFDCINNLFESGKSGFAWKKEKEKSVSARDRTGDLARVRRT